MKHLRHLYSPLQPAAGISTRQVFYQELLPHPDLQPFIYCYWQLKSETPLTESFRYHVVADGCIDIVFEISQPDESFVMGFSDRYASFDLGTSFHYVGVRFLPTMFPQLFNVDASEISNQIAPTNTVAAATGAFIADRFHPGQGAPEIKNTFDAHFLKAFSRPDVRWDKRLYDALEIILLKKGSLQLERDIDTGLSSRQLQRLFKFYIGGTSKAFSKIVRFQHVLSRFSSGRPGTDFYDAGYYDQAHYIRDFRQLYGLTPCKARQAM